MSAQGVSESPPSPAAGEAGGLTPWLQLLRLPNAFTVPGDVVAGWFLSGGTAVAGGATLALLIGASLCIYFAGLILNDCFDVDRDRRERPGRPLPSGRIAPATAWSAGVALLTLGILLAALTGALGPVIVAAGLGILVLLYNGPARTVPAIGFLTMGLCRGTNILLGASVARLDRDIVLLTAGIATAYIVAVTAAAAAETRGPPRGTARWAPLAIPAIGLPVLLAVYSAGFTAAGIACASLVLFLVFRIANSFKPHLPAADVPPKIGALIRALIPLQAAFILIAPGDTLLPALMILCLLPLSVIAGRRFHGS